MLLMNVCSGYIELLIAGIPLTPLGLIKRRAMPAASPQAHFEMVLCITPKSALRG